MKVFEDLDFTTIELDPWMEGVQSRMMFDNGYGVSVICHKYSYGGKKGLHEIAVLDKNGKLTYDTPVTNDVIGYLSKTGVTNVMRQVQELK